MFKKVLSCLIIAGFLFAVVGCGGGGGGGGGGVLGTTFAKVAGVVVIGALLMSGVGAGLSPAAAAFAASVREKPDRPMVSIQSALSPERIAAMKNSPWRLSFTQESKGYRYALPDSKFPEYSSGTVFMAYAYWDVASDTLVYTSDKSKAESVIFDFYRCDAVENTSSGQMKSRTTGLFIYINALKKDADEVLMGISDQEITGTVGNASFKVTNLSNNFDDLANATYIYYKPADWFNPSIPTDELIPMTGSHEGGKLILTQDNSVEEIVSHVNYDGTTVAKVTETTNGAIKTTYVNVISGAEVSGPTATATASIMSHLTKAQ